MQGLFNKNLISFYRYLFLLRRNAGMSQASFSFSFGLWSKSFLVASVPEEDEVGDVETAGFV
jgi:hypothetical protein